MEYNQRIFVCVVLVFIFGKCVSTSRLSAIKNWPARSKDVLETYNNCSGLKLLSDDLQPKYSKHTSFIRKCCPHGSSYDLAFDKENEKTTRRCTASKLNFSVSVINALFYENCIEDNETIQPLSYNYVNACTFDEDTTGHMLLYAKAYGDLLYVLQNGSLLIVEENFESYEVQSDYCLDEGSEGLFAIVCVRSNTRQVRMLRGEAVIYAVCLWLSVPCLLLTAFFYLRIDSLRELHGRSLSAHCTCLALAYALLGLVQVQLSVRVLLTYFIQYFLLACICWLSALCCDICIKILYIYIKKVSCSINTETIYLPAYAIASFGLPVLPVFYAMSQNKFGIPHYYIKGQHVNNLFTGDHFIIPSTVLLLFCCVCLCITFYAFRRRQPKIPNENWNPEAVTEYEEFFKLKGTAKNVALLLAVVSICRLIEMITSRLNASIGADDAAADTISPFAIFDIFIALQGLFIFIIFVCSPKPLWMIKSWWISSGSLDLVAVTNSELGALTKDNAS